MYEEILRARLKTLYEDLTCSSDEAIQLVGFMNTCLTDKAAVLKDMYYKDHAPVKVLNPAYDVKGGVKDIEAEIIAVGEGYDQFVRKLSLKTTNILNRHKSALNVFVHILTLPDPYSRLLYLRFFKCMEMDDVMNEMFMSKSACYRKLERGIKLLNERLSLKE